MERMRRVRAEIAEMDAAHRYKHSVGVDVYLGDAKFTGNNNEVEVNG